MINNSELEKITNAVCLIARQAVAVILALQAEDHLACSTRSRHFGSGRKLVFPGINRLYAPNSS